MTQQEADNLVRQIYDSIFDSVTKAEPGGKPLAPSSSTVLSLMKPGMMINPVDFRNPWTPGNMNGNKDAAVNTARLADVAPKLSALWEDSGREISKVYGDIMDNVQIPAQKKNEAIEAQLAAAYAVLYRTVQVPDPDTGQLTTKEAESQLFRDYLDNQAAYFNARQAYVAAYLAAQETASGKASWPMVAPTLQIPVKAAYNKWRSNYADKIEQNLAIMSTSSQNALSKAFNKAKQIYDGYGVVLEETGSGQAPLIHRASLLPSDWYSRDSASKWISVQVRSGSTMSSSSSDYTSYGGSAGFSLGIFSIGGSAGHSKESRHSSNETKNMEIGFDYTMVTIRRPWLSYQLLATEGWNLQNLYKKGKISTGVKNKTNQANSAMPLLPTSFVVVRNVKIKADWAKSDFDFLKSTTTGGGSIGIGPFSIGGSYTGSHTKQTFQSAFAGASIIVPGVQIIGWISQVVPLCPPADEKK